MEHSLIFRDSHSLEICFASVRTLTWEPQLPLHIFQKHNTSFTFHWDRECSDGSVKCDTFNLKLSDLFKSCRPQRAAVDGGSLAGWRTWTLFNTSRLMSYADTVKGRGTLQSVHDSKHVLWTLSFKFFVNVSTGHAQTLITQLILQTDHYMSTSAVSICLKPAEELCYMQCHKWTHQLWKMEILLNRNTTAGQDRFPQVQVWCQRESPASAWFIEVKSVFVWVAGVKLKWSDHSECSV